MDMRYLWAVVFLAIGFAFLPFLSTTIWLVADKLASIWGKTRPSGKNRTGVAYWVGLLLGLVGYFAIPFVVALALSPVPRGVRYACLISWGIGTTCSVRWGNRRNHE